MAPLVSHRSPLTPSRPRRSRSRTERSRSRNRRSRCRNGRSRWAEIRTLPRIPATKSGACPLRLDGKAGSYIGAWCRPMADGWQHGHPTTMQSESRSSVRAPGWGTAPPTLSAAVGARPFPASGLAHRRGMVHSCRTIYCGRLRYAPLTCGCISCILLPLEDHAAPKFPRKPPGGYGSRLLGERGVVTSGLSGEPTCESVDQVRAGADLQVKFYDDPSDPDNCVAVLASLINSSNPLWVSAGIEFAETFAMMARTGYALYGTACQNGAWFQPPAHLRHLDDSAGLYRFYFTAILHNGSGRALEVRPLLLLDPSTAVQQCVLECQRRHGYIV